MDTLAHGQPISPMPEMVVEVKELPSRGLGYPEGLKFYYRSYTFGEIKQVSTTNDIDLPQIIESVMKGVRSGDENFNKNNMSFVDMLYIGLLRRVSSQGHLKYQIPYQCEKCGQVSQAVFGSEDIDFQEISEDVPALPLMVTLAGSEFHFTYPTVQNMLDVKLGRNKKKKGNAAVEITASTVTNMSFDEAYAKLIAITDPEELEVLSEIDSLLFHDIKAIKAICLKKVEGEDGLDATTCSHTNYVSIEGKELLIRPFREREGTARTKIRFGNKQDG